MSRLEKSVKCCSANYLQIVDVSVRPSHSAIYTHVGAPDVFTETDPRLDFDFLWQFAGFGLADGVNTYKIDIFSSLIGGDSFRPTFQADEHCDHFFAVYGAAIGDEHYIIGIVYNGKRRRLWS